MHQQLPAHRQVTNLPHDHSNDHGDRASSPISVQGVDHVCEKLSVSQWRACQLLGQPRATQRHIRKIPEDEERLVERIVTLAGQEGRYGYRRITALLRNEGWRVNHMRVERIWRQEGLKVPRKQPKRG